MPVVTVAGAASTEELPAHLGVPPVGDGPWPGVVVLHEAFGLNDDIRQIADRFAAAGYLAAAPDLFAAGGRLRCLRSTFASLAAREGPAFGDIEATRRYLAERPDCTGRVGVVGFCMGGGFALLAATRGFDASAPSYGMVPQDVGQLLDGACPVVASYGARDVALRGAADRLERALGEAGVEHDVHEYAEAGHSFMNRNATGPLRVLTKVARIDYHQASAEDAWGRILRFFANHLH